MDLLDGPTGFTDWIAECTFWLDLLDGGVGFEENLEGPGKPL
jgi:hypothetical protein